MPGIRQQDGALGGCAILGANEMPRLLLPIVLLFWAGLLFGVAYLATPAVFTAGSVTRAVGIDATRQSFSLLNRAEIVLACLAVLLLIRKAASSRMVIGCAALACAIVALETFVLLPELQSRSDMVVAGNEPPPSPIHTLYISADTLELLALLTGGIASVRRLRAEPKEIAS